jgi:hypothetical protein
LTITNETIQKENHGVDNKDGAQYISGVYQWINKIYEAQIYNYGLRTMYDVMIPEPIVLIDIMRNRYKHAIEVSNPPTFDLIYLVYIGQIACYSTFDRT